MVESTNREEIWARDEKRDLNILNSSGFGTTFIFSYNVLCLLVQKFIRMPKCGLVKIICYRNFLLNGETGCRSSKTRIAFSKLKSHRGENHLLHDILVGFHSIFCITSTKEIKYLVL